MDPIEINLAIGSLVILLQYLASDIQANDKLTDEQKKGFIDRLDVIKKLVEESKFPDEETT